jgi:hypothetical protein
MAAPISGNWAAIHSNAADYTGAKRWGTGVSELYAAIGAGVPLRMTGRNPEQAEYREVPAALLPGEFYGYTMEDLPQGTDDAFMVGVPPWTDRPEVTRGSSGEFPPPSLQARPNGPSGNWFRSVHQMGMLKAAHDPTAYPTETVSEGWLNKEHGQINDAEVSADAQYTRQTSMQQVNPQAGRNNDAAVARGTDDARFNIMTRLTGMKVKPWSEGQRLQDMFPYQQDLILRPWWWRRMGVGREQDMVTNEFQPTLSVQRNPPSEPYTGPDEAGGSDTGDYGYTPEDVTYAY